MRVWRDRLALVVAFSLLRQVCLASPLGSKETCSSDTCATSLYQRGLKAGTYLSDFDQPEDNIGLQQNGTSESDEEDNVTRQAFESLDVDDSSDVTAFELATGLANANISLEGEERNFSMSDAEEYVSIYDRDHSLSLTLDEFMGTNSTTEDNGSLSFVQADGCKFVEHYWKSVGGPCRWYWSGWLLKCDSRRRARKLFSRWVDKPITCLEKALEEFDFVPKKECSDTGAAVATPCSDLEKISAKMRNENAAVPEEWAARVIDEVAIEAGVFYSDPKLAYDLAQSENVLSLVEQMKDGYVTLNPDPDMLQFIRDNDIKTPDDFVEKLKIDAKAKQWRKLVSSGLDVIGTIAGPAGVALSVVGAVLDFHQTADAKKQQELLAKSIYENVMKEVEKLMLNSNAANAQRFYNDQRSEIRGWMQGFESEYKTTMEQIKAIRQAKMAHGGLTQLLLMNSLMLDVGSTRFQWLKGSIEDFHCSFDDIPRKCNWGSWQTVQLRYLAYKGPNPGFGDYGSSSCVLFRNHLILFVAPLISLHLSLIHAMTILSTGVGGMTGVLQTKLFEMASEYQTWLNKFELSRCWQRTDPGAWRANKWPCNKPGKIILCAPFKCPWWCDGTHWNCNYRHCDYAWNTEWPIWQKIERLKVSVQGLLDKQPASLLQVDTNTSLHRQLAFERFKKHGPLAVEFGEICGGFECLVGEPSEVQRELLRGLGRRAAAMLFNRSS